MDGGDYRQPCGLAQQRTDHIGPGAVAVDELIAALPDIGRQLAPDAQDIVTAADHGGDAQVTGLLGKGAVPEAQQLGVDMLIQVLQQAQHVGLGSAGVAAADQMNDFHGTPFFRLGLVKQ